MTTTALPDLPAADTGVAHDGAAGLVVPLDLYRAQRHRRRVPVVGGFFLGLVVATALSLPVWALIIAAARWVI